ncbi:MAG: hypothetical protein DDT23_01333 [candidate division WS2 bacterium]|nr:hypothetical protein [Candidatus Lithacetigena glycinireducens]
MQQKKIDDNLLLELHKQGLNQKQIAERLGVSNVAIHKRLRHLCPPPLPESFEALTEPQKKFAIEVAKGETATNAALKSYEVTSRESAKVIGSNLMKHPQIREAVEDLMHEEGLTKRYRIRRLKQHVDSPDGFISLKALDMSFKLDGTYKEKEEEYEEIIFIPSKGVSQDPVTGKTMPIPDTAIMIRRRN